MSKMSDEIEPQKDGSLDAELLDKTELSIENVELKDVNLNDVANKVAQVLQISSDEVFVIDARDKLLTLDIMRTTINAHALIGKESELIKCLGEVKGITVTAATTIASRGVLGWVMVDSQYGHAALQRSQEIRNEIQANIAKRAIVFATGPEVIQGQIEDTNSPLIAERLQQLGFNVTQGTSLIDDKLVIVSHLREAATERGFGLLITTGGVGAENKDHAIEALLTLDPQAATPYIAKFEAGTGRHVKDGIRIGVAQIGHCLLVALPGPNAEVDIGMNALIEGLQDGMDKEALADNIVNVLRQRWRGHHHHEPSKDPQ